MAENSAAERKRGIGRPFLPGASGNPGGRPKAVRELLDVARQSVPKALAFAVALLDNEECDARVRLDAAKFLCSYGLGAPPKAVESSDDEDVGDAITIEEARALAGLGAPPPKKDEPH